MKRAKKVLSAVAVSALAAAQMAMPVMADGGKLDVTTETIAPIIRVVVPTSMQIAVNQFEVNDTGSQIYSSPFTMSNKSELPVKVSVKSTATLKSTTQLVDTKAEVATAEAGGAWLAVAAASAANTYTDGATTFENLTEASKNVAAFTQGDGTTATAKQTFYLAGTTAAYKLLHVGETVPTDVGYAQFFLLTPVTIDTTSAATKQTSLDDALAENDIYYNATGAANGAALTKEEKNDTAGTLTHSDSAVYYTVSAVPTAKDKVDGTKPYLYADGTVAAAGAAEFRYMGKLSEAQDSWTKDDISKVTIEYDITGVKGSQYTTVAAISGFTYGHVPAVAPAITTTEYTVNTAANTEVSVTLGSGDKGAKGIKSVIWEGEELLNDADEDAKFENGKVVIDASVGKYFSDNDLLPATVTVVFDMEDADAEFSVDITLKK